MSINEHIEKIFGQNNYNEKREIYSPENFQKKVIKNTISKTDKKLSNRKIINFNNNNNNENISTLSNKSNQALKLIPFVDQNTDNSFYSKFMKKIKEEENDNNNNNHIKNSMNSKTVQKKKIKPGYLKKEKSESNFHSKNCLDKKKDIGSFFKRNNSIESNESKGIKTPNNKMKLNFNKNFNTDYNEKKSCKTLLKKDNEIGHVRTQNLFSSVNHLNYNKKLNLNQNQINKSKNIGFNIENEVIQNAIQLEIINNLKNFKVLKIETKVTSDQIIKNVDFSNVKKLNINLKNGTSNNNDIKITDNVNNNDETKYQVPNNVLTQKKNPIFCCF